MEENVGIRVEGMTADDTVLVIGPPMTGKYQLLLRLLADYCDRVILVSTGRQAARIRDDFREAAPDVPEDRIAVIDCVSRRESFDDVRETDLVKFVSSPQNLTGIGVKFTELYSDFQDAPFDGQTGVGLHSVSQLLMHAETKQVYQFMQVLAGQTRSAGWTGVAVLDTGAVDEEEVQMLQHHFDGVLETRENDDGEREFRSRGLTPAASDWQSF